MSRLRAPEVASPRAMARTIASFFTVGGIAGLLVTLSTDSAVSRAVVIGLAGAAFLAAGVVYRWGPRWPRSAFHVVIAGGGLMIDAAVLTRTTPGTAVVTAALMSFIVFDAYLFFPMRVANVHLAAGLLGVTAALTVQGEVAFSTAVALDVIMVALASASRTLVHHAAGASRDPLTDLHNRRGFDGAIQRLLAPLPRSGDRLSAALLDLDGFKTINDTHGHEAGDQVLRRVADVFSRALPRTAVFARHGGDEFALLLPGLAGSPAVQLLRRVCADNPDLRLSVGVAEYAPGEGAAQLMRRADRALYAAKTAGRGRCELDDGVASELVRDLAAAVATGQVGVHLQPIVSLADAQVLGVEALARWDRPGHGPVSPEVFIALAEQNGLILDLGEHVLRSACTQLAEVRARTGRRLRLGVNVSGRELCDPSYPDRVRAVFLETGWPAGETVLEVTESLLDAESAGAAATLHAVREQGVRVAIDDFGTGWSSLSRLDTLPVDILKIDHSFTATIATSPRRAQMLRSIAGMAQVLGLDVVAEGVETVEQHELVREVGCSFGQGSLYGRPVPVADLLDVLGDAPDRTRVAATAPTS